MSRPSIRPRSRIYEVLRKGRSSSTQNLVFKALPGAEGFRFAVVTPRKLGTAVVRNKVRRRIKSSMAEVGKNVPSAGSLDVVIMPRPGVQSIDFDKLRAEIHQGMEKLAR